MDLIKISGIEWDLKEKLDVTLERPDVTLYGFIELLVCHFILFCFVLFCLGVCQRMFAVFFAFILEDCVLPLSVCHPTQPTKMYFLKYSIFVLTPRSLPFLHPFRPPIRQRAAFAKAVIHALKRVQTNDPRPQKLSTPASSLKSPPTSYPPCRRLRRQIPHR